MNINELFFKTLEIQDPWYIKSADLSNNQLTIEIDFKRGATFEDDDNGNDISKSYKAFSTVIKKWRHL